MCTKLRYYVTSKYIRGQVQQAINNPADEVGVKTKTLICGVTVLMYGFQRIIL